MNGQGWEMDRVDGKTVVSVRVTLVSHIAYGGVLQYGSVYTNKIISSLRFLWSHTVPHCFSVHMHR